MGLLGKFKGSALVPADPVRAQIQAATAAELDAISAVAIVSAGQISALNRLSSRAQAGHAVVVQMGHGLANGDPMLDDELRSIRTINLAGTQQILVNSMARMDRAGLRGLL